MRTRTTSSLVDEGHSPATIRRLVDAGDLHPVRRGVYATAPPAGSSGAEAHRRLIGATAPLLVPSTVISHHSAGLLHGVPVWVGASSPVSVIRPGQGGNRSRHVHLRRGDVPSADLTEIDGMQVTSLPRTLIDLGRAEVYDRAVAALDAGLRLGVDRDDLRARADGLIRAPGVRGLRAALEFADARAESVGESLSRVVLSRCGIPAPTLQYVIRDSRTGAFLARVDFAWPELRIAGEFDGRVKYDGTYGQGADAIMREKRREAALCADGWRVMRWVWSHLSEPEELIRMWETVTR